MNRSTGFGQIPQPKSVQARRGNSLKATPSGVMYPLGLLTDGSPTPDQSGGATVLAITLPSPKHRKGLLLYHSLTVFRGSVLDIPPYHCCEPALVRRGVFNGMKAIST